MTPCRALQSVVSRHAICESFGLPEHAFVQTSAAAAWLGAPQARARFAHRSRQRVLICMPPSALPGVKSSSERSEAVPHAIAKVSEKRASFMRFAHREARAGSPLTCRSHLFFDPF